MSGFLSPLASPFLLTFQSLQSRCTSRLPASDLMTNEPLLHLSCPRVPCAPAVDGTQLRICCKLFILYCSIKHHFVWPGLICCPGRALERKTNTQLLNRKVTGREIVWVHWVLLLWNICAVLQDCADNQNEMTGPEWWERIFKIFLYLSDSGCCTSTTNTSLGISLSDHNIKAKNRSEKCLV